MLWTSSRPWHIKAVLSTVVLKYLELVYVAGNTFNMYFYVYPILAKERHKASCLFAAKHELPIRW